MITKQNNQIKQEPLLVRIGNRYFYSDEKRLLTASKKPMKVTLLIRRQTD